MHIPLLQPMVVLRIAMTNIMLQTDRPPPIPPTPCLPRRLQLLRNLPPRRLHFRHYPPGVPHRRILHLHRPAVQNMG